MSESDTADIRPGRRRFLQESLRSACAAGLVSLGLGLYNRQARALPATAIRPPGALPEQDFLGACVRCGLCARDCPYDTLSLAELGDAVALGTPYFVARSVPCEMCETIPCIKACPTDALDHGLTEINRARMGLALVVDHETCIAFQGLRCEVCFNSCPVGGKAIRLELRHNPRTGMHALFIPVVYSSNCTGCGKCENACILDEAAIRVLPIALAKGMLGRHYRLGWKEKQAAGRSLVSPDPEHRYNLPEGMRYDDSGRGLIRNSDNDTLFPSNPLDTLNRKGGP